ncbi:MAG: cytochrome P450 [Acidimicrobiales bacterium]
MASTWLGLRMSGEDRVDAKGVIMVQRVDELELPEVDMVGTGRDESLRAMQAASRQHWLARTPMGYLVTRHEDVVALLRDRRFHSALSLIPQLAGIDDDQFLQRRRQSILSMEGDAHTRVRRIVSGAFTPRRADRLRPFMREVIGRLVDTVAAQGRCEFVADICEPYPIPIICELLGAPQDDWKLFSDWATDIFRIFNNNLAEDMHAINRASAELDDYVRDLISGRRSHPGDDLLSDLIAAEEQGDRLDTDEVVMLAEAVLMAGTDTTRNQLACSVALFTRDPDQWRLLAERPELAPRAVEETMRLLGAIRGTARFASVDVEYRDVLFPAGTLVAASLASANRDPEVWPLDDTPDITRDAGSTAQLTFGSGIHYCLGAALARAELQEALPLLARRMPDLTLSAPIEWKPATVGIWGPARMPLRFAAAPASVAH